MKSFAFLLILAMVGCAKKPEPSKMYSFQFRKGDDVVVQCTGGDPFPKPALPANVSGDVADLSKEKWKILSAQEPGHVEHCELVGKHTVDDLVNGLVFSYDRSIWQ